MSSGDGLLPGFLFIISPISPRVNSEYLAGGVGIGPRMIFCTRPDMLDASKGTFAAHSS